MTHKTGALVNIGIHKLGFHDRFTYFRCVDCKTDYPMIDGLIKCNGKSIEQCPYCTE